MAYLVRATVEDLKYDAGIINEAGIIRGSIQRVTKLVLSDSEQSPDELIMNINRLIGRFISMEKENGYGDSEKKFFKGIQALDEKWKSLKHGLDKYQESRSNQLKKEIIEKSEDCWDAAVAVVQIAQLVTEEKVKSIKKLFNLILILNTISAILVILLIFSYVRKKLEYESSHDPLTHLYNRRTYENVLESELARSKRYNSPLSLVLFDVDYFKNINDQYGHHTGDKVLIKLAEVITESIRETDSLFRIGGEEFAIISPETNADVAFKLAEKVRNTTENHSFEKCNKLTISLGLAEYYHDVSKEKLYKHADRALYLAKEKGRNRTEVFNGNE